MSYLDINDDIKKYYKLCKHGDNIELDVDFSLTLDPNIEEYFGIELDGDKKYIMKNEYLTYNSNGKSTTISLIHDTLGDYSGTLASQVVTRKRTGAGQASPDLADKMGKRFLAIQEPDPEDQIYVGQMKELSAGNDKIVARALYGNPFYYKPQFKMVLCCNKLPHIPSNDGGTWRRLRVTPWTTQFVDLNFPKNEMKSHQFYKDPSLEDDMKKWPQAFIWLLLNKYYSDYIKNGLGEPKIVTQFTDKYKKDSDIYLEFLEQWIEDPGDEDYEESIVVMYKVFKIWHKEAYSTAVPPQKDFISYLENKFTVEKGKVRGVKLKIGE
jgi:phage/plasmid-associated DNA primase